MKKYIIALLFTLSLIGSSYASIVDTYLRYGVDSEVNHNNLNGNFDLIRNTINGDLNNANTATNFRLFEILSSLPLAGEEGRIVFRTTDNTLNIDDGSAWVYSPTYSGDAVQGNTLYFNGTTWARLAVGTLGNTLRTGGASANPAWAALNLAGGSAYVSGLLPLLNGGTNANITASAGTVIYSDSTKFAQTQVGPTGAFLQSNGSSAPVFVKVDLAAATDVTGILPATSGGTGSSGAAGGDLEGTYPDPTLRTSIPQNVQEFTSTGTWTRPAGIDIVYVKVWGGGGGGGSIVTSPGGGGGGGGYSEGLVAVTGNVTVTIGAGGAAETAGGNSSFAGSTTPTANGGAAASDQSGGAGGAGSNGTINLTGGAGATVAGTTQSGGVGGGSSMGGAGGGGGGGNGSGAGATGAIGASPGGGGGGGGGSSAGTGTGGAGADGLVIVYY